MEVRSALLILAVLAAATASAEQAYALGEKPEDVREKIVIVSCFKENPDGGNYVGSLSVTSPQAAGRRCNSTYYDCQGACLGCFADTNGIQVCYDKEGQRVK